jgi:hypothetical protein
MKLTPRAVLVSAVACAAAVALFAWLFELSAERAIVLAPLIVVAFAGVIGLFMLWGRVALESLRASRHPRRVIAIAVGAVGLIAVLTALGVELPRE